MQHDDIFLADLFLHKNSLLRLFQSMSIYLPFQSSMVHHYPPINVKISIVLSYSTIIIFLYDKEQSLINVIYLATVFSPTIISGTNHFIIDHNINAFVSMPTFTFTVVDEWNINNLQRNKIRICISMLMYKALYEYIFYSSYCQIVQ